MRKPLFPCLPLRPPRRLMRVRVGVGWGPLGCQHPNYGTTNLYFNSSSMCLRACVADSAARETNAGPVRGKWGVEWQKIKIQTQFEILKYSLFFPRELRVYPTLNIFRWANWQHQHYHKNSVLFNLNCRARFQVGDLGVK